MLCLELVYNYCSMKPTRVTDSEAQRWECQKRAADWLQTKRKKKKKQAADFVIIDGTMKTCGWIC